MSQLCSLPGVAAHALQARVRAGGCEAVALCPVVGGFPGSPLGARPVTLAPSRRRRVRLVASTSEDVVREVRGAER